MGHNTLSRIPGTKKWRAVVSMLGTDASTPDVVSASAAAAELNLLRAAEDPAYVEAIRLLLAIPHAARSDDFADALRRLDLEIGQDPGLVDLMLAVTARLDHVRRTHGVPSDFGELSGRALSSTLSDMVNASLPGLFEATAADVQVAVRTLGWSKGVSELVRGFYGRLLRETLSYWLDRTLADHVGPGARFATARDKVEFDRDLEVYAAEATRIVKEFSSGWYGKTLHRDGEISTHSAKVFGGVALKKVVEELKAKRADA
ncbi:hypothetical protein [Oceanibium sediminis]|uniref:hypothetical protein n=1 Tax=Oceanibium sediminis TaxID=2026339 RepID=UPI000DD35BB9|nr:hypothetical protein [Oceanibium sediminis]